jgi:alpha-galactosidase
MKMFSGDFAMRFVAAVSAAVLASLMLAAHIPIIRAQGAPTPKTRTMPVRRPAAPEAEALTPPMGWNSWNFFAGRVTDRDIRNAADQLVASGMKDAGYIYVNIDDTWEGDRDADGVLHTNSKFPDMKALADYVHSKGLKLGIYSSPGPKTCAGFAASLDHEAQDAQLYASWGVDYLKYDLCSFRESVMTAQSPDDKAAQMRMMIAAYDKMDKALKATGRPIVYSLCQYGWDAVWEWGPHVGANVWRTTGDIQANWQSIYSILNEQAGLAKYAGPGHWNDPDMLEVGNGQQMGTGQKAHFVALSPAENRTHFSMWAMLAAPLLAGNDLPNMTPEVRAILTNRDVIAIDQDPLGREGTRAYSDGEVDVWTRELSGGAKAIAVVNAGSDRYATHPFHLSLAKLGLHGAQKGRDLWTGKETTLTDNMPLEIASHDILLVTIAAPK